MFAFYSRRIFCLQMTRILKLKIECCQTSCYVDLPVHVQINVQCQQTTQLPAPRSGPRPARPITCTPRSNADRRAVVKYHTFYDSLGLYTCATQCTLVTVFICTVVAWQRRLRAFQKFLTSCCMIRNVKICTALHVECSATVLRKGWRK